MNLGSANPSIPLYLKQKGRSFWSDLTNRPGSPHHLFQPETLKSHQIFQPLTRLLLVTDNNDVVPKSVYETIMQFHYMDPDGQTFRYPFRKSGKPTLPKQQLYDIKYIRDSMEDVYNYFSGFDTWLDENAQAAFDYLQEIQTENQDYVF